jgi:CUB/sushi domain-containing protein
MHSYRSVAHYECQEGYQLFGPERRNCTDQGTWTERGPQCQSNFNQKHSTCSLIVLFHCVFLVEGVWCEEPQPPLHGFVMGTGRQYGDKVRYACSAGFRLRGESNENVCNSSGLWSKPAPQCQGTVMRNTICFISLSHFDN